MVLPEAGRRPLFLLAPARNRVVVQTDCARIGTNVPAQVIHPCHVAVQAAAGNELRHGLCFRPNESRVMVVQIREVLRRHVAAAAPILVADAEEGDLERRGAPILRP
jgi:hypothetical protein